MWIIRKKDNTGQELPLTHSEQIYLYQIKLRLAIILLLVTVGMLLITIVSSFFLTRWAARFAFTLGEQQGITETVTVFLNSNVPTTTTAL